MTRFSSNLALIAEGVLSRRYFQVQSVDDWDTYRGRDASLMGRVVGKVRGKIGRNWIA